MIFNRFFVFVLVASLAGCVTSWRAPDDFIYVPMHAGDFDIATWQHLTDNNAPVRIYIEGDGHSFTGRGLPTSDPTPRGTLVRDLAVADGGANVVYMARPCQFIASDSCTQSEWTIGRFSRRNVDAMAIAIRRIATNRPIVLIGYSGGAMISGLIIQNNPDLDVREWVTVAGVLNHADWTKYFGDSPLSQSMNLNELPRVSSRHYVAQYDDVVPYELSKQWTGGKNMIVVPGATHGDFGNLKIN